MATATYDALIGALIGLVRAANGSSYGLTTAETDHLILQGLTSDAHSGDLHDLISQTEAEKARLAPNCALCTASCGRTQNYDMALLQNEAEDTRTLKYRILAASRTAADRLLSASPCRESCRILYKTLFVLGEAWSAEQLEGVLAELTDN